MLVWWRWRSNKERSSNQTKAGTYPWYLFVNHVVNITLLSSSLSLWFGFGARASCFEWAKNCVSSLERMQGFFVLAYRRDLCTAYHWQMQQLNASKTIDLVLSMQGFFVLAYRRETISATCHGQWWQLNTTIALVGRSITNLKRSGNIVLVLR